MSWSMEFAARNKAAALHQIELQSKANPGFPTAVAETLAAQINAMNDDPRAVFMVRTCGHVGSADATQTYGPMDIAEITVRHVWFFDPPPAPAAEVDADPEQAEADAGPLHDAADPDALAAAVKAHNAANPCAIEEEAPAES